MGKGSVGGYFLISQGNLGFPWSALLVAAVTEKSREKHLPCTDVLFFPANYEVIFHFFVFKLTKIISPFDKLVSLKT